MGRVQLSAALRALALAAAGWATVVPAGAAGAAADAPRLHATLDDAVQPLPGGRIAWQTAWSLCWAPVDGAQGYELQVLTGEGAGRRLQRQQATCRRLEVARGENLASEGLARREMLLAMQAGQLAYRVRAVFADGRAGAWSVPFAVGQVEPGSWPDAEHAQQHGAH